jgi:hypothetical protein
VSRPWQFSIYPARRGADTGGAGHFARQLPGGTMPLINSTDRLSFGIPAIDSQYRKLVDTINQLHEA